MRFRTYLFALPEKKGKKQRRKEREIKKEGKEEKERRKERKKRKERIGQSRPNNNATKINITIPFLFEIFIDLVLYIYV